MPTLSGECLCEAVRYAYEGPLGGVRGELGDRPTSHIFVGSKSPWCEPPEGAHTYDELPPDASLVHQLLDDSS